MTYEELTKPMVMRYEVTGCSHPVEEEGAARILLRIYNLTADRMNNGGIELFNSAWNKVHPNSWTSKEYDEAYEDYFKAAADVFSELVRSGGLTYKLRKNEPVILNPKEGWFKIFGYKDQK